MIRTREEALQALSEIMHLERRAQLVRLTVFTAQCLTPETRRILFRAQEGVVSGGKLASSRPPPPVEPPSAPRRDRPTTTRSSRQEPMDEAKLLEEVTTAFEAINVASMAMEVFPELRQSFARWEVARLALYSYRDVQEIIAAGTNPATARAAYEKLHRAIVRFKPWWHAEVVRIAEVCEAILRRVPPNPWHLGAKSLLDIVATTDLRPMYAAQTTLPNREAMIESLVKIYRAVHEMLQTKYPEGLPAELGMEE